MNGTEEAAPGAGGWGRYLRGHLLLFEPAPRPALAPAAGVRLLALAAGLETVRLSALAWLRPLLPLWLLLPLLLGLALAAVPRLTGVPLPQLGFRRWTAWTATERSYFLQVGVLVSVLLAAGVAALGTGIRPEEPLRGLGSVFVPFLFFGFYQELVYRGMVQAELVRRWSPAAGVVVANLLYTFGPLHWSYLAAPAARAAPMLAAVFLVGLFFGTLYLRSGNMWIVACFHAFGNASLVWLLGSGAP